MNDLKNQDVVDRLSPAMEIMARRAAFSSYNISRIRELIRYLPPRKYKLFQSIPFWLHVNRPQTPGHVGDARATFGIYRFRETGFWKQNLSALNRSEKDLLPYLSPQDHIQGLYLMGSSGTLAQTDASDFDYWVVINEKRMASTGKELLKKKLSDIEIYCRERYDQAVSFFVLDEEQVRENRFDIMDEESSGSAQRTLLKEEFYRTFIFISGRIPYWAVLPAGLDDNRYQQHIDTAAKSGHLRFIPDDFIDLGNLVFLDRLESLGAVLWQVFKARHSPFKSFIKATLIAHYFFSKGDGFLCDTIKTRYYRRESGNLLVDPYALMFQKGLEFLEELEDTESVELLRACIFLRMSGGKPYSGESNGSPREALLCAYVQKWDWDGKQIQRMSNYRQWSEDEKLQFEKVVFRKVSFLYDLILKGKDTNGTTVAMTDRDLTILANRIAGHFRQEPGKIPRCSSYVAKNLSTFQPVVSGKGEENETETWSVYGREGRRTVHHDALLFKGPELLKSAAWMIVNGLYRGKGSSIGFQSDGLCQVSGNQARRFVQSVYEFFEESVAVDDPFYHPPAWTRLVVCPHRSGKHVKKRLVRADFLVANTWGEFFFDILPLDSSDTDAHACYNIAEHIWIFTRDKPSFKLPYRVIHTVGSEGDKTEKTISRFMAAFMKSAEDRKALSPLSDEDPDYGRRDDRLLLDR